MLNAKVTGRKRDANGNPIGLANKNPVLDTREYEVTFLDRTSDTYTANIITESIFTQVDDEVHEFLLMREIGEHQKDGTAMARDDMFICSQTDRCGDASSQRGGNS